MVKAGEARCSLPWLRAERGEGGLRCTLPWWPGRRCRSPGRRWGWRWALREAAGCWPARPPLPCPWSAWAPASGRSGPASCPPGTWCCVSRTLGWPPDCNPSTHRHTMQKLVKHKGLSMGTRGVNAMLGAIPCELDIWTNSKTFPDNTSYCGRAVNMPWFCLHSRKYYCNLIANVTLLLLKESHWED